MEVQASKAKEAKQLLDKAIKASPSRGAALLERAAYFLRLNKPKDAERDFKAAANTFNTEEKDLWNSSERAADSSNFPRARRFQEEALDARRANGQVWFGLGQLRLSEGKTDEAIGLFEQALEADRALCSARLELAELLEKTSRVEEAITHLEILVETDWSNAEAHFRLGENALAEKNLEKAEMHFLIVTDIVPDHKEAKSRLRKLAKK